MHHTRGKINSLNWAVRCYAQPGACPCRNIDRSAAALPAEQLQLLVLKPRLSWAGLRFDSSGVEEFGDGDRGFGVRGSWGWLSPPLASGQAPKSHPNFLQGQPPSAPG